MTIFTVCSFLVKCLPTFVIRILLVSQNKMLSVHSLPIFGRVSVQPVLPEAPL